MSLPNFSSLNLNDVPSTPINQRINNGVPDAPQRRRITNNLNGGGIPRHLVFPDMPGVDNEGNMNLPPVNGNLQ
jgi:hypothetical protein